MQQNQTRADVGFDALAHKVARHFTCGYYNAAADIAAVRSEHGDEAAIAIVEGWLKR